MNIKQKIVHAGIAMGIVLSAVAVAPLPAAEAAQCAGVQTSLIPCTQTGGTSGSAKDSGVWGLLLLVLNILTAGVGIAAVGGIVFAAVLYSSASDRPDQVQKAKDTIRNVVVGIAAYAGMYLILNFLIPGGIFS
jgi:hypothetical protein